MEKSLDTITDFFKACRKDLVLSKKKKKSRGSGALSSVLVYGKAQNTARRDFNLYTESEIKQFIVDVGEQCCHHDQYDTLDENIWFIPKGHGFNVYFFDYKTSKTGYLAILFYKPKNCWVIKSLAKNTKNFSNPFGEILGNMFPQKS